MEEIFFFFTYLPTRADVSNCTQAAVKGSLNNPNLRDIYMILQVHLHVRFRNLNVSLGWKCHLIAEKQI